MNLITKTLISLSLITSSAFAAPANTCQDSAHLQVSPVHKKISYGISKSQVWKANKGAIIELTGEDPYKVTYSIKCEELIDSLDAKARKGANVEF